MKKKIVLICIIVLLLSLALAIGLKYYSAGLIHLEDNDKNETSALFSLDKVKWLVYENKDYGFTFDYPEKVVDSSYWTSQPEKLTSFNLNTLEANNVLAKDNIIYIKSGNHSFDAVEAEYEKNKNEYGPGIDPSWRIVVEDVNDEKELDAFIKRRYGKGCSYQEKIATSFSDTFDIAIRGDGKPLDSTECGVNYNYYLKYSPVNKRVASWNTSQECQIGLSFDKCFDDQINRSFRFIDNQPGNGLKPCPSAVLGLKFDYPQDWGNCRVDGQRIFFRTDFEEHQVDLVAEIRELDKPMDDKLIKEEKIVGMNNSKVYNVTCGGAIACTGLNINDEHFYEIDWDVASDQVVPKDLEGVWRPDYGFTLDDIWNILKSVKN